MLPLRGASTFVHLLKSPGASVRGQFVIRYIGQAGVKAKPNPLARRPRRRRDQRQLRRNGRTGAEPGRALCRRWRRRRSAPLGVQQHHRRAHRRPGKTVGGAIGRRLPFERDPGLHHPAISAPRSIRHFDPEQPVSNRNLERSLISGLRCFGKPSTSLRGGNVRVVLRGDGRLLTIEPNVGRTVWC